MHKPTENGCKSVKKNCWGDKYMQTWLQIKWNAPFLGDITVCASEIHGFVFKSIQYSQLKFNSIVLLQHSYVRVFIFFFSYCNVNDTTVFRLHSFVLPIWSRKNIFYRKCIAFAHQKECCAQWNDTKWNISIWQLTPRMTVIFDAIALWHRWI